MSATATAQTAPAPSVTPTHTPHFTARFLTIAPFGPDYVHFPAVVLESTHARFIFDLRTGDLCYAYAIGAPSANTYKNGDLPLNIACAEIASTPLSQFVEPVTDPDTNKPVYPTLTPTALTHFRKCFKR